MIIIIIIIVIILLGLGYFGYKEWQFQKLEPYRKALLERHRDYVKVMRKYNNLQDALGEIPKLPPDDFLKSVDKLTKSDYAKLVLSKKFKTNVGGKYLECPTGEYIDTVGVSSDRVAKVGCSDGTILTLNTSPVLAKYYDFGKGFNGIAEKGAVYPDGVMIGSGKKYTCPKDNYLSGLNSQFDLVCSI